MNFGLITDATAINSYYIKDGIAYDYIKNKPYIYHHAFSSECFVAMMNLPFIFEFGCYINWIEWQDKELPDYDLDLIFYDNGKIGLEDEHYDNYTVAKLKEKYPNAKILGWIKEVNVKNKTRLKNRVKFLNECDAVVTSGISDNFKNLDVFKYLKSVVDKEFHFISQPVNIDYLFDNFYSDEKDIAIWAYLPNPMYRRGRTYEFADYLGSKYNVEVRTKPLHPGQKFDYISQRDFIEMWSRCAFHFNMDPSDIHPGNQIMQTAAVGCLNIGGLNEAHSIMYPETATCDETVLEKKFVEYLNDENKRFEAIQYAWNKLNEIYSFKSVINQINQIYGELG
jgi:hypothetical protein|tara:strand:- start:1795 stop:2808 length:1014 start_codon:yes stop_codon:yes gene_type:complete